MCLGMQYLFDFEWVAASGLLNMLLFEEIFIVFLCGDNICAHVDIHRFAFATMTINGLNIWRLLEFGLGFSPLLILRDFCFCSATFF